jgi:hypothetical protein
MTELEPGSAFVDIGFQDSERERFELSVQLLTIQLLSRKPLSTTQPPLREAVRNIS